MDFSEDEEVTSGTLKASLEGLLCLLKRGLRGDVPHRAAVLACIHESMSKFEELLKLITSGTPEADDVREERDVLAQMVRALRAQEADDADDADDTDAVADEASRRRSDADDAEGGHALVPSARCTHGLSQVLHPRRPLVCRLHLW